MAHRNVTLNVQIEWTLDGPTREIADLTAKAERLLERLPLFGGALVGGNLSLSLGKETLILKNLGKTANKPARKVEATQKVAPVAAPKVKPTISPEVLAQKRSQQESATLAMMMKADQHAKDIGPRIDPLRKQHLSWEAVSRTLTKQGFRGRTGAKFTGWTARCVYERWLSLTGQTEPAAPAQAKPLGHLNGHDTATVVM
jgi:hypothetical protein